MNALLIHPDGRAEQVFGSFDGDPVQAAVLTQAALSALECGQPCQAVQCRHAGSWTTLLPQRGGRWLRLSHAPGLTVEQAQAWAATLPLPALEEVPPPAAAASAPVFPEIGNLTTIPAPGPARVPSLADALNVQMP